MLKKKIPLKFLLVFAHLADYYYPEEEDERGRAGCVQKEWQMLCKRVKSCHKIVATTMRQNSSDDDVTK